jgi:hypothetical protein
MDGHWDGTVTARDDTHNRIRGMIDVVWTPTRLKRWDGCRALANGGETTCRTVLLWRKKATAPQTWKIIIGRQPTRISALN